MLHTPFLSPYFLAALSLTSPAMREKIGNLEEKLYCVYIPVDLGHQRDLREPGIGFNAQGYHDEWGHCLAAFLAASSASLGPSA